MKTVAILVGIFISFSAASEDSISNSQQPSVEILGFAVFRGMPEGDVRAAFPNVHCAEEKPVDPVFDRCSVSDGVPPDADGEVTFKDGVVHSATRNWFIDEGAEPLEVLTMLNMLLTRLAGEEQAVCAKIETYSGQEPEYTIFALPRKILTVQMHTMPGRGIAYFRESLRVNPVPAELETRGKKAQGKEWCAFAN